MAAEIVRLRDVVKEMPGNMTVTEASLGTFLRDHLGAEKRRVRLSDRSRPHLWAIRDTAAWARRSNEMWLAGFTHRPLIGVAVETKATGAGDG